LLIILNGEEKDFPDNLTISSLIKVLSLSDERIAVELNREIVRRREWESTVLSAGDNVEIVHFVGGGS
jgi:sulfur carrier protein